MENHKFKVEKSKADGSVWLLTLKESRSTFRVYKTYQDAWSETHCYSFRPVTLGNATAAKQIHEAAQWYLREYLSYQDFNYCLELKSIITVGAYYLHESDGGRRLPSLFSDIPAYDFA